MHGEACRHEGAVELHALQRPIERHQPVAREARDAPMDGEPLLAGAPLGSAVAHAAHPDAAYILPSLGEGHRLERVARAEPVRSLALSAVASSPVLTPRHRDRPPRWTATRRAVGYIGWYSGLPTSSQLTCSHMESHTSSW